MANLREQAFQPIRGRHEAHKNLVFTGNGVTCLVGNSLLKDRANLLSLEQWFQHDHQCNYLMLRDSHALPCTCGLDAALQKIVEQNNAH